MKRPWTKEPWQPWVIDYVYLGSSCIDEAKANSKLMQKAPDMAELLIRLIEDSAIIEAFDPHGSVIETAFKARQLLKEIGYELLDPDATE